LWRLRPDLLASLERRALLGVKNLSQTAPSNARRSACAANHAAARFLPFRNAICIGARRDDGLFFFHTIAALFF
jgi:hypothetical protein